MYLSIEFRWHYTKYFNASQQCTFSKVNNIHSYDNFILSTLLSTAATVHCNTSCVMFISTLRALKHPPHDFVPYGRAKCVIIRQINI